MSSNFHVLDDNPNDATTGACVCHKGKSQGCDGPFAVFPEQALEDNLAPHVVICETCVTEAATRIAEHKDHRAKQDEAEAQASRKETALPEPTIVEPAPAEPSEAASLETRFADPDPESFVASEDVPEV